MCRAVEPVDRLEHESGDQRCSGSLGELVCQHGGGEEEEEKAVPLAEWLLECSGDAFGIMTQSSEPG